ncbi:hypothetical protein L7F22_068003 [Adiantum nelumboides]|nr:hypothetical protein [Adiantum nelumboides]
MTVDLITILGELSFSEQINEISQFAGQKKDAEAHAALIQKAEAAQDESSRKAIVNQIVSEIHNVPGEANDREVEGIFNLLGNVIINNFSDDQQSAKSLFEHILKVLTAPESTAATTIGQANDKALVRYRILSNLYNALPNSSANRFIVFNSLLQFANANDDLDIISDALTALPTWLAEWDISPLEKANLLTKVAENFEAAGQPKRAYEFLLLHVRFLGTSTLSGEGSSAATTKQAAERTISAALSLPSVFEFEELAQIEAVQKLQSEPIGKLLNVFLQGNTKDFIQWRDANASEVTRLKLSAAQLERKIQLLDLANLCSRSISSTVSYSEIAKTLNVDLEEVEVWVIDVIRAGLVSGKLSQINQSLRVYKSVYRSFGTDQWRLLETRLSTWEKSIASILQTLAEARQSGHTVPREIGVPGADSATAKQQQNQITA